VGNRQVPWNQVIAERGSNSAVECQLPKLDVAGSIPVSRSMFSITWEGFTVSGLVRLVL
jgi:hypothetical protein